MQTRTFLTRLAAAVLLATTLACAGRRRPDGAETGAASARLAVDRFLGAVAAQDLQALSTIWGTAKGPARDQMNRAELERRELLMMCYLTHTSYLVQEETGGAGGTRVFRVALTRSGTTRQTAFTTVRGPADRWYVQDADLTQLQAFCNRPR